MATQLPSMVQNENLHFSMGNGAAGPKVDVSKSENRQGPKVRKALQDISRCGRPSLLNASKVPSLKEKSIRNSHDVKRTPKISELTEEEIMRCNKWAKEGIEHVHFSGNDLLALQKDNAEERVKKKAQKVMSALRDWTEMSYGFRRPSEELGKMCNDFTKLELEPEVLLPMNRPLSTSDDERLDDLLLGEVHGIWPLPDLLVGDFDLKLKEEHDGTIVCM